MDDYERQKQAYLEELARREEEYLREQERRQQLERERERKRRLKELATRLARKEAVAAGKRVAGAAGKATARLVAAAIRAAVTAIVDFLIAALPVIGVILLIIVLIVVVLIVLTAICESQNFTGTLARTGSTFTSLVMGQDYCKVLSRTFGGLVTTIDQGRLSLCQNLPALAQQNNTLYPAQNDPGLDRLISCITSRVASTGEISTYDKTAETCNYTRGQSLCETCSHSPNSCHYGGLTGTTGALAVDFGNQANGANILREAISCSSSLNIPLRRAACEDDNSNAVSCINALATHIHISIAKCTSDNGPINNE